MSFQIKTIKTWSNKENENEEEDSDFLVLTNCDKNLLDLLIDQGYKFISNNNGVALCYKYKDWFLMRTLPGILYGQFMSLNLVVTSFLNVGINMGVNDSGEIDDSEYLDHVKDTLGLPTIIVDNQDHNQDANYQEYFHGRNLSANSRIWFIENYLQPVDNTNFKFLI